MVTNTYPFTTLCFEIKSGSISTPNPGAGGNRYHSIITFQIGSGTNQRNFFVKAFEFMKWTGIWNGRNKMHHIQIS